MGRSEVRHPSRGPLLFLLYINDLPDNLHSQVCLFADDCIVYRNVTTYLETRSFSKKIWNPSQNGKIVGNEFQRWKVLCSSYSWISRKSIITDYKLGNATFQETESHSYLGVEIQKDLKWNTHINKITASASKTLGFVRHNLGSCTKETKTAAYVSLVRPTLEYSSAVWDPTLKNSDKKWVKSNAGQLERYTITMTGKLASPNSHGSLT